MRRFFLIALFSLLLGACNNAKIPIKPSINIVEFPGFSVDKLRKDKDFNLSGYEFQTNANKYLVVTSCEQASNIESALIPEFDYFRFNLLLLSCAALEKYSQAGDSESTYFTTPFDEGFYKHLPAEITPLLSKAYLEARMNKTMIDFDKKMQVVIENKHTGKLVNANDEIYITVLAQGDFNGDRLEDLMIKSEWFARKASGKHADLLIVTKTSVDKAMNIYWRLHRLEL